MDLSQSVPGIEPMTASCCLSAVSDPQDFPNGRNFAAWIGLVPYQHSTGVNLESLVYQSVVIKNYENCSSMPLDLFSGEILR